MFVAGLSRFRRSEVGLLENRTRRHIRLIPSWKGFCGAVLDVLPANLTDCPFKSIRDDVGSKTAGCAYVGSAEASFQTRPICSVVRTDVNFYEHWLI